MNRNDFIAIASVIYRASSMDRAIVGSYMKMDVAQSIHAAQKQAQGLEEMNSAPWDHSGMHIVEPGQQ